MLKIWLNWLHPSVGVLGTALVLSSPFCAAAATKPATVRNTPKAPTPVSQWSSLRATTTNGTRIDRELSSAMAVTPDLAVRQLATNALGTPSLPSINAVSKQLPTKRIPIANFTSPAAKSPKLATRLAIKPTKQSNADVGAAIARAINPQAAVPVPGLYIPNSNTRSASKSVAIKQPIAQPVASASVEIGAPTPLSSMMAAKVAIDPYPVVRPELMQKLERRMPVTASTPTPKTSPVIIQPIGLIPTAKQPVQAKAATQTKIPLHSLDPIATIPSGLQRLLGNNLNSQPTIAATSVVSKKVAKPNALLALKPFITPTTATIPPSVTAARLRLATAQAYNTSVPKFSIPGETLLTAKQPKPTTEIVAVKRNNNRQNITTAVATTPKNSYVTRLATIQKPWTTADRPNNLGGLILGSQPLAIAPGVASLLPSEPSATVVLPVRDLVEVQ
jgi:hypothetical protein